MLKERFKIIVYLSGMVIGESFYQESYPSVEEIERTVVEYGGDTARVDKSYQMTLSY